MKRIKRLSVLIFLMAFMCVNISACSSSSGLAADDSKITMDQTEQTISVGGKVQLSYSNASDGGNVSWSSSDQSVATVNGGEVTGVGAGTTSISVKDSNGSISTCQVTVKPVEVEKVILNKNSATVRAKKTVQLTATVQPEEAKNVQLNWVSSDEEVAVVNSSGLVTAKSKGVTNITCQSENGISASCTVTVKKKKTKKTKVVSQGSSGSVNNYYKLNTDPDSDDIATAEWIYRKYGGADIISYSSSLYLDYSDISNLTAAERTIARNEIFARHGYSFTKNPMVEYYFEVLRGIKGTSKSVNLNEVEKYNVDYLK